MNASRIPPKNAAMMALQSAKQSSPNPPPSMTSTTPNRLSSSLRKNTPLTSNSSTTRSKPKAILRLNVENRRASITKFPRRCAMQTTCLRRARAIPNPMPRTILASIALCRISAVPTWRKNAPCPIPAVRIKFKVAPCPIPVAQTPRKVDLCPIPAGSIKPKIADW